MTQPRFERDLFVRDPGGHANAIEMAPDSSPELKDNVFIGYAEVIKTDAARRDQLLQQNLVVGLPGSTSPSRRRPR
jgi:hypothetical protein